MTKTKNTLSLLIAAAVLAISSYSKAATIDYSCLAGTVYDAGGGVASNTDIVMLGSFGNSFNFTSNTTYAALLSAWNTATVGFTGNTITMSTGASSGEFYGEAAYTGSQALKLYIWIVSADHSAWAIITNPDATWTAAADPGNTGGAVSIDTSFPAGCVVPSGAAGTVNGSTGDVHLQTVPEPSSLALLGSGLLMAGSMIRRRK